SSGGSAARTSSISDWLRSRRFSNPSRLSSAQSIASASRSIRVFTAGPPASSTSPPGRPRRWTAPPWRSRRGSRGSGGRTGIARLPPCRSTPWLGRSGIGRTGCSARRRANRRECGGGPRRSPGWRGGLSWYSWPTSGRCVLAAVLRSVDHAAVGDLPARGGAVADGDPGSEVGVVRDPGALPDDRAGIDLGTVPDAGAGTDGHAAPGLRGVADLDILLDHRRAPDLRAGADVGSRADDRALADV